MMRRILALFAIGAIGGMVLAGGPAARAAEPATAPADHRAQDGVAADVLSSMDRSADPCQNFYRYACGGWLDSTELPADQSRWARSFSVIHERNREILHGMLEDAAANPGSDPDRGRIGRFYASCMDEEAVAKAGIHPLEPMLAEIAGVKDAASLMAAAGKLFRWNVDPLFRLRVRPDFKNPDMNILNLGQGGLGLPERDYYLSQKPKKQAILAAYRKHVARMLSLLGEDEETAAHHAEEVVAFETRLAEASRPAPEMRKMDELYHKLDIDGLRKLTPELAWPRFLTTAGYPGITQINVATPEFFEALQKTVLATGPEALQAYLRWHLVHATAGFLPQPFVEENFHFFGTTLRGQKEIEPRWKRCVQATERALGEAVGKLYVEQQFPGDSKEVAQEMIHDIEGAFQGNLPSLSWMDDATRARALDKMHAIQNKIGYPAHWRDYSSLSIVPDDFFANAVAAAQFEFDRRTRKVGQPVDRSEWRMTPQTVNAYYNPQVNEIVFPAGILQPPFFRRDFPAAMNYGGIGAVVGHELTHGFDDQGRKFDPQGRLREWWEPQVAARFEKRAQCVDDLYSTYEVEPGVHVQGDLTLGEDIADIGGLKQAYGAFKRWEKRHPGADGKPTVPGLTDDQLFFVAYGQVWCSLTTPEMARVRVQVDPHAPPRFRVLGATSNNPAFARAFHCAPGTPMNPKNRCELW